MKMISFVKRIQMWPELVKEGEFKPKTREQNAEVSAPPNVDERILDLDEDFLRETNEKINKLSPESAELLGESERKYLALLREKDEGSFIHSLGVLNMGRKKLDVFSEELAQEGVLRADFLRACALHDLGKIDLPDCVLKGTISWAQFETKFFEFKNQNTEFVSDRLRQMHLLGEEQDVNDLSDEAIKKMNLNYRDLVSLEFLFAGEPEKLKEIARYDIDPARTSFFDVIRLHEARSREIIQNMSGLADKEVVAEIAGSHHGYDKTEDERYPAAKETLRLTVLANELLHLVDVYDAIRQRRSYKEECSEIEALAILVKETRQGKFKDRIARKWIKDSMENLEKQKHDFSGQNERYEIVKKFIETI